MAEPSTPGAPAAGTSTAGSVVSAKHGAVRVGAVTVPRSATEGTRALLREAIERQLAELDANAGAGYSVSVALIQLRHYIGPDSDEPRTVCIVDLALHDANGVLVGSVRGRVSATSVTAREALDAASRSAVSRVPEALRIAARSGTPAVEARGVSARR